MGTNAARLSDLNSCCTNDGSASAGEATGDYAYWDGDGDVVVTLTYELTGSATGYDITSINTIYEIHVVAEDPALFSQVLASFELL